VSPATADAGPARHRPTLAKIVATIGPASDAPEMVERLIVAGVAVFRLNFSHGTLEQHRRRLETIRAAALRLGQPVAVLGDLQGPKIRVGSLPETGVVLEPGQDVLFAAPSVAADLGPTFGAAAVLPSEYEALADEVKPGHRVLVNDGLIRLLAVDHEPADPRGVLRCRVLAGAGGLVTSRKGINLPDSDVKAEAITERDWECVEWSVANGLDFLALSFVRRAEEVRRLKRALAGMCPADFKVDHTGVGAMIPVVAKIEKPQALNEIDAIVDAADAIMVARGDLGVEMDLARVPIIQKQIIAKCDEWGKPCIVATQMLESMITSSSPTRAEVSDIANAVLDGADAVMLSAESAAGKFPLLAVETMRRVVAAAEERAVLGMTQPSPGSQLVRSRYRTAALAHGAWHVANDVGARLVACWSQEGGCARYLSQTGMPMPIVAYSDSDRHVRRMALLRGVTARHMPVPPSRTLREWNLRVEEDLRGLGWVKDGDPIVLIAGKPLGVKGAANTLTIHYTGNRSTGFLAE
jgi:pyruvate kinase